jgi:catechol 2,3-dioxygenase-like lactoylglutathione lyase family enzyme
MPWLFSYGTLQQEAVQLSTFGRRLRGVADELVGFEQSIRTITDPDFVTTSGKADHAIVRFNGRTESRVRGMALEVTDSELSSADRYEPAGYTRIATTLASGRRAWVYADAAGAPNVTQAVPFFGVADIGASLRFYVDALGFTVKRQWAPDGRIRWCWIEREEVALMLQEYWTDGAPGGGPAGPRGQGMSICFMCRDAIAIYHEATSRGLAPAAPFVGNGLWVTSFTDPDGYRLDFESPADAPEETVYIDPA